MAEPRDISVGTPNLTEAPGGMRRFFRFSQLAVGSAGKDRKIEDIWATFLRELEDLGIPEEARSRIQSLGAKKVFGKSGLPKSVASVLDKPNLDIVKEVQKAARTATKGINESTLSKMWPQILSQWEKEGHFAGAEGARMLEELKKVNPKTVARVGSNQVMSALARRGDEPFVVKMFNSALKRPSLPKLPEGITETLKQASGGKLPKVARGTGAALTAEGVGGMGFGRKLLGATGKGALGFGATALFAGLEAKRAAGILGRESRAKKLALQGFQSLGPASSVEFLRDIVQKQESVARRKAVMQQFEPELFQDIVRTLADTGQSKNTLTSTERRIGSSAQAGAVNRGRSPEDVKFLLDQLFSQMGGTPTDGTF